MTTPQRYLGLSLTLLLLAACSEEKVTSPNLPPGGTTLTPAPVAALAPTSTCSGILCVTLDDSTIVRKDSVDGAPKTTITATATMTGGFTNTDASELAAAPAGNWGNYSTNTIPITCGSNTYTSNQAREWVRTQRTFDNVKYALSLGGTDLVGSPFAAISGSATATQDIAVPGIDGAYSVSMTAVAQADSTATVTRHREYRYKSGGTIVYSDCTEWTTVPSGNTPISTTTTTGTATRSAVTVTESYVVDLVPGTFDGEIAATGGVAGLGGDFTVKGALVGASRAGDQFGMTVTAKQTSGATFGVSLANDPTYTTRALSGTLAGQIGYNWGNAGFAVPVPCTAALGDYEVTASFTGLKDIEGYEFDPSPTVIDTVTVASDINLVNTTTVYGFVTDPADGTLKYMNLSTTGFTSVQAKRAVNTNPGAFHVTQLVKHNGLCTGDQTVNFKLANGNANDLELVAPAGFDFVKTGQTFAKVYAGLADQIFDFEKPALSGIATGGDVTSLLGPNFEAKSAYSSSTGATLSVQLDQLDPKVKGDYKVFVRARVRYVGTTAPTPEQAFLFTGRVWVDGYNGSAQSTNKTNSYTLYHAPVPLP